MVLRYHLTKNAVTIRLRYPPNLQIGARGTCPGRGRGEESAKSEVQNGGPRAQRRQRPASLVQTRGTGGAERGQRASSPPHRKKRREGWRGAGD